MATTTTKRSRTSSTTKGKRTGGVKGPAARRVVKTKTTGRSQKKR